MSDLLDTLLAIAAGAGKIIREVYETPFVVSFKGPKDPVTVADVRANTFICDELERSFPGVPVVAEESDPSAFEGYRTAPQVFFVDPLDGTAEFVARNGEFVVMIGLVTGERATAGVILAPTTGVAWAAERGIGAFRVDPGGQRTELRASECTSLGEARVMASRSHRSVDLERALAWLGAGSMITMGSAGLKGATVAAGDAEVYVGLGKTGKRWDVCATDAIVTAAGGKFSDGDGAPFDYRAANLVNERGLIATNGHLYDSVLERLRTLSPPR